MKETIFVVDDAATSLVRAKEALGELYAVITISSAKKMFAILEKKLPKLILLDIEMLEMDGFEAIELLKADSRFASIPVIFLSGNHDAETESKCYELGAADYITKPFTNQWLLQKVKEYVR